MNIKKHIPNFVTTLNGACGFIAVVYAFNGSYDTAFLFIFLAAFFDFLDGGVARILNVQSELGKQMDSLCDVVSFGVAPGVILFSMLCETFDLTPATIIKEGTSIEIISAFSALIVTVFSIIRLAKFNIDTRQTDSFIGLPVPANAIFISSLAALSTNLAPGWTPEWLVEGISSPITLIIIAIIQSYLLVSPLPMFALKFKNLSWNNNKVRFIFLASAAILVVTCSVLGLALTIALYICISLIINLMQKQ